MQLLSQHSADVMLNLHNDEVENKELTLLNNSTDSTEWLLKT